MAFFIDTWGSQWCPDHPCLSPFLFASLLCSFLLPYICNELESCLYHHFHSLSNSFFMFLSLAFNCPPEFQRDERTHVPFRIPSALVVILCRHKTCPFCISMAEDCKMFWYLMDSTGWKMEKLMPFLSELLLPEASFPAHDIMMSWPSTTFAFDFKGLIESCPIRVLNGLLEEERVWYPRQVSGVLVHQQF